MKKTAIFSVSSLGLGHATRTLPVLKKYVPSHRIHVISCGNALAFLKKELAGHDKGPAGDVIFHELNDYPPIERGAGAGWKFYWYLVLDSVRTVFVIKREHAFVAALAEKIRPEFVFSDGRYGSYVKGIPSFILSHQISFVMPAGLGFFQRLADHFNLKTFRNFDVLFIPDYENPDESLGGDLSHHPMLSRVDHHYIGILSSLSDDAGDWPKEKNAEKDVDFLFTVSGYLSEHKASFVDTLVERAKRLPGKKIFILGESEDDFRRTMPEYGIEIHSSASGDFRRELFGRAKFVVSRAGYSTIMDLVELDLPGLLVPTPGQTEQEYLAPLHGRTERFLFLPHDRMDFGLLEAGRRRIRPFKPEWKTAMTVEKIRKVIADRINRSS